MFFLNNAIDLETIIRPSYISNLVNEIYITCIKKISNNKKVWFIRTHLICTCTYMGGQGQLESSFKYVYPLKKITIGLNGQLQFFKPQDLYCIDQFQFLTMILFR